MLQEATKILSSAFGDSFIKRLSLYLHDCVREEVKSSTFRNLNQDKDNKWVFLEGEEKLLTNIDMPILLDGADSKITELMLQAEISQKDRYLIYGYLFITGKNPRRKKEEFLTPLLYLPCRLERTGVSISCSIADEMLSLNTGALAGLLKYDDEDEVEHLFEGLIDVVPDLPLTEEKIQIFLTTLKSIIPELDYKLGTGLTKIQTSKTTNKDPEDFDPIEFIQEQENKSSSGKLTLSNSAAIILTKRPTITAGVLHELTQIAETPKGIFRETALNVIQEEFTRSSKSKFQQGGMSFDEKKSDKNKEFYPITPLELSDSQRQVIEATRNYPIINVYGPPGTGKSQTIVNLVSHLVASGKTVLVASRMDKAVDVVSERLNSLGAPFLCLRAGRANYQKQLNFQLQDLLSNKVDLDTGFENAVLTDIEDMKNLIKNKKEIEDKCEKILQLERDWFEVLQKLENHKKEFGEVKFIHKDLTKSEIENFRGLLNKIESSMNKSGFFSSLTAKFSLRSLCKKLKLSNAELSGETIDQIRLDLTAKEYSLNLKTIEGSISKIGNLHQLLANIRDLRKKQKTLAVDILKNQRREALKSLTRDQSKRQRLIIHSKALVERKKNLQNRLLHDEDFKPLMEAFPCWAVTTYAISESLPLKPGLFDVAIIDEASQCDIASCFPVLFRAKSAVIVGDDKQLPHLSFLEKSKEQSFLSQYNIPDRYQLMWRFRTNSIFDLANFYSAHPVLLDEHFRSSPDIINFSNQEFYGNRIRIMSNEVTAANSKCCIELNVVKDAKVDLDNTRNMAEVEKIMEKVQEIIINDEKITGKPPVSIGIISPFRGQVDLIKKAVCQVLTEDIVKKHQIEVGTAHTFQGDERDIILLSFTIAPNSHYQSLTFIQKPNLFNVAITRARKQLICYISKPLEDLQPGMLRSYLEYIQMAGKKASAPIIEHYNNSIEEEIAKLLKDEALTVIPNYESAGFKIDLVVTDGEKSVAVMCDGFDYSDYKDNGKISKEVWMQSILERCGWKIIRITARDWYYSKKACISRIKEKLIRI